MGAIVVVAFGRWRHPCLGFGRRTLFASALLRARSTVVEHQSVGLESISDASAGDTWALISLIAASTSVRRAPSRDRNRVSRDEDYEVEYFARENGVTIEQVRELIKANGSDREALIEAARVLREGK